MATYYSIITNRGAELEAEALANGGTVIVTQFAVGDGNGQAQIPDPALTELVNEVYRGDISGKTVSPDQPNQTIAQLVLPDNVGGFTIREIGLLTDAGELYAIGNCAAIEKPTTGVSLTINFRLAVSPTSEITIIVATGDGLFLRQDANLGDVKDKAAARVNLELGSSSMHDDSDYVNTVNNIPPDANGNVAIDADDVGAVGTSGEQWMTGWLHSPGVSVEAPVQVNINLSPDTDLVGQVGADGPGGTVYLHNSRSGKTLVLRLDGVMSHNGGAEFDGNVTVTGQSRAGSARVDTDIFAETGVGTNGDVVAGLSVYEGGGLRRVYSADYPPPPPEASWNQAIGAHLFASIGPGDATPGSLWPGSAIAPMSMYFSADTRAAFHSGAAGSWTGTWMMLGQCSAADGAMGSGTMFVRIA